MLIPWNCLPGLLGVRVDDLTVMSKQAMENALAASRRITWHLTRKRDPCSILPSIMPSINLAELLKQEESKTLEFKRDLSSPDKALQAIVAFANTSGGILVIGVENQTKRVCTISDPLKEEERLANLIADRIEPRLIPSIEIIAWRSAQVLVAEIYPSQNRPHYIKSFGPDKGVFVRIGSTNRKADGPLIAEMQRFVRNETYDESPLPHLNSEALDFRAASELFAKYKSIDTSKLETLRALVRHGRKLVPTVGGLLLFGKAHENEFPDAWVQCGRFSGTDKSNIADTLECHGILPRLVEDAFAFIQKHSTNRLLIDGLKRTESPSIPLRVARELLLNAIVHADYAQHGAPIRVSLFDDRLEIENPGILLSGLTVDDIKHGISKLRNRTIGRVFKELGYIEQWGSGIQRVIEECKQAGLPEPVFQELAFRFRVTVSLKPERAPTLDTTMTLIRDALMTVGAADGLSSQQLADHAGISSRAMRTRLSKLLNAGLVIAVGKNPRDPHRKYYWKSGIHNK